MALFDWTPAMQLEKWTGLDGITAAMAGIMAGPGGQQAASALTGSGKQGTDTADIFNTLGGIFGGSMATSPGGSGSPFDFTKLIMGGGGAKSGNGNDPLTAMLSMMGENSSGYSGGSGGGSGGMGDIFGSLGSIFGGGGGGGGSFGGGDLGDLISTGMNLFGGGNKPKAVTWDTWNPELQKMFIDASKAVAPDLQTTTKQYNKQTAIDDASGVVDSIFRQFQQQLPQIYNQQTARGAFNSTATQGLADQAQGEAVAKSAQAVLDNIKTYAAIRQGDVSVLSQMLGTGKGSIQGQVPSQGGKSDGDMMGDLVKIGAKLFGM